LFGFRSEFGSHSKGPCVAHCLGRSCSNLSSQVPARNQPPGHPPATAAHCSGTLTLMTSPFLVSSVVRTEVSSCSQWSAGVSPPSHWKKTPEFSPCFKSDYLSFQLSSLQFASTPNHPSVSVGTYRSPDRSEPGQAVFLTSVDACLSFAQRTTTGQLVHHVRAGLQPRKTTWPDGRRPVYLRWLRVRTVPGGLGILPSMQVEDTGSKWTSCLTLSVNCTSTLVTHFGSRIPLDRMEKCSVEPHRKPRCCAAMHQRNWSQLTATPELDG